jgi:prolyl-tRNA editing enzyme YbaK/EbsC (Cys-tRNA(Pro) deacylase)
LRGSIEVHHYLVERSIPHEFYRLERPLRRIDEASAVLGLDPGIVVAAELFESAAGYVLALTPASMCASADAVARAAGVRRVRAMSKARTAVLTGYMADWLPPVGHEIATRAVVERSLLGADVLYSAGGDPGVMIVMRSEDLVRATAAVPASLAVPAERAGMAEAPASAAS